MKKIDWKFWFIIVGIIFNFIVSVKIMDNELRHISADITEIKTDLKEIKIGLNDSRNLIERLDERTRR